MKAIIDFSKATTKFDNCDSMTMFVDNGEYEMQISWDDHGSKHVVFFQDLDSGMVVEVPISTSGRHMTIELDNFKVADPTFPGEKLSAKEHAIMVEMAMTLAIDIDGRMGEDYSIEAHGGKSYKE